MRTLLMALALSLVLAAPASADYTVTSLTGDWTGHSVTLVSNGVEFSGSGGGSLTYSGANGNNVGSLTNLSYTFSYHSSDTSGGSAPWLQLYTPAGNVVLQPSLSTPFPTQDQTLTYNMVDGSPELINQLASLKDQPILNIDIMTFAGSDTSALVSRFQTNDLGFVFSNGVDEEPPPPDPGDEPPAAEPPVADLEAESVDEDLFEAEPDSYVELPDVATVASKRLVGATKRTLHIPKRKGERLVSARVSLRGKPLHVRGRVFVVDLRGKPVGKYNVRIVAKYRKHHKLHVVKTTRHLSIKEL